jgi:hypothetical protein
MAAVGFQLGDRIYGLDADQAQLLAGQMRRRLTVPEHIEELADEIWEQSMLNPDTERSHNVVLTTEKKRALLETLTHVSPDGDRAAWENLAGVLRRDLGNEP